MSRLRDSDARLDTIRGLLAKAEATEFPAEAEAFTAKASELMARYSIDDAMLWADHHDPSELPGEIRIALLRPFTAQKAVLVHGIASVFGCQAIRLGRNVGADHELISIVGFSADLTLVETLVTSLFVQLTTAMTNHPDRPQRATASQVSAWRRSFISGFADTVTTRLQHDRALATAQADADHHEREAAAASTTSRRRGERSTDLVLADRADAVRSDTRRRYPHVRTSRVSSGTDGRGRRAGAVAGRSADIGNQRLRAQRALPKG